MGLTAPLRLVVRKSQKTLGQKKPSMLAAIWYVDAVRMMRRAQWFLISLPIFGVRGGFERSLERGERLIWILDSWVGGEKRGGEQIGG